MDQLLWIRTNTDGDIEELSCSARRLLGSHCGPGQNLYLFFPANMRAMARDAEVASTGWPNVRTTVLEPLGRKPLAVRYVVSASDDGTAVLLNWFFHLEPFTAANN